MWESHFGREMGSRRLACGRRGQSYLSGFGSRLVCLVWAALEFVV